MNNYYNVNYARVGVLLHPTFLRKPIMVAFMKAMMTPLDNLDKSFRAYYESLDTNTYSQVCYMQGVLNDNFDPLERRISITPAALDKNSFLYWLQSKNRPVRIYKEGSSGFIPRLESKEGQIGTANPDFRVVLPAGFVLSESEEARMRAFVNQNKLASKQYIITNG